MSRTSFASSAAAIVGAVLVTSLLSAAPAQGQEKLPLVVSDAWLAKRLDAPKQVILHAAATKAEYDAGHVPGARLMPFSTYAPTRDGLSSQMASVAQLDSALEAVGVSDGDALVIYGQPLQVARLLVTLDYLGLKGRAAVLDGGIDAWREGGRPVSTEVPTVSAGSFTPRVDSTVVADLAFVQGAAEQKNVRILDARAPEFYLGHSPGQMPRAGHIPGAKNVPFSSLTSELTTQRDEGKVRRLFAQAGVGAGDTVVTYCHIGMQASLLYLAARRLGLNARIYDGSWEEWSKNAALPSEK
jgi:thiosulfate/3-mercaptopyruvate sulfurtransferase